MVAMDGPPGKPAVSHVKTIAFDGKLSAALVRIETGRTHQIRVHMQARRTPVAGDDDYGNKESNKKLLKMLASSAAKNSGSNSSPTALRPLLHAYETEIIHPYTGERLLFQAPVPDDIAMLLRRIAPLLDDETATSTPRAIASYSSLLDDRGYLKISTDVPGRKFSASDKTTFVPSERVLMDQVSIPTV
jgi:hypothetical protein